MDPEIKALEHLPDVMRLGEEELDLQHAGMFERLGELDAPRAMDGIRTLVWELLRYTREHFVAEERFMERIGFPGLSNHRILHDGILKDLVRLASRNLQAQEARKDFQDFVRGWLRDHIESADREIVDFHRAKLQSF